MSTSTGYRRHDHRQGRRRNGSPEAEPCRERTGEESLVLEMREKCERCGLLLPADSSEARI